MQSEPIATWRSSRFLPLPICSASFFYLTTVVRNFQPPVRRVPRWQDMTYDFCQINYLPYISRRTTIHWQRHGQAHRLDAGDAREVPTLLGVRHVSSAARLLGLRVRIPPAAWMSLVLSGRGLCSRPIIRPETHTEYVCVSYCVMRCSNNPLHLPQWVGSSGLHEKKKTEIWSRQNGLTVQSAICVSTVISGTIWP
jgi:hypothetical protein